MIKIKSIFRKRKFSYYNKEHYPDPTAYNAIVREEKELMDSVCNLVHVIKTICDFAGFEVVGRIEFRHKKSGKSFK